MLFLEQTKGFAVGDNASVTPSLYELLMQERMAASIKPAVEYVVHVLCESYPNLARMLPMRRLDESYMLLRLCIEKYFLSKYDSLMIEKYYGLKRVKRHAASREADATTGPLTSQARNRALLLTVVVPYLKNKLDVYFRETAERLTRRTTSSTDDREQQIGNYLRRVRTFQYLQSFKKGFVVTYPFAHFVYEGVFFLYQWLYLFGDTPYFSPFLRLLKTVLVKITPDDEAARRQNEVTYRADVMDKLAGSSLLNKVQRLALRVTWAAIDHSYMLLLLGVAGYKFVEWMYSEEGVAAKLRLTGTNAPLLPPPLPPQISGQSLALVTMDATLCPLCKKMRVNPALTPSGFVFCYPCIYRYVEQHGECPVTQMKCDGTTIIKIYDDARDSPFLSADS